MPALAGEPFRSNARIHLKEATGNFFAIASASAAPLGGFPYTAGGTGNVTTWEAAAGGSLTIKVARIFNGTPTDSTRFTHYRLRVAVPGNAAAGASVTGTFPDTNTQQEASHTLHFDTDPLNGVAGAAAFGMLELILEVWRDVDNDGVEDVGDWGVTTKIDSRGGGGNGGAVATAKDWSRGYVRAKGDLTSMVTKLGAAVVARLIYPNAPTVEAVLTQTPLRSIQPVMRHVKSDGTVVRARQEAASTATTRSVAFNGTAAADAHRRVDNVAGGGGLGTYPQPGTVAADIELPNHTFGGTTTDSEYEWASVPAGFTAINNRQLRGPQDVTVDPRLTISRHMQLNNNVIAPASEAGTNQRLTADLAFVATRVRDADGSNVAGITVGQSLRDDGALTTAQTNSSATDANGICSPITWDEALPGGGWTNTVTLSDAAGTQGTGTVALTLLALDPRIVVVAGGGGRTDGASHFTPGQTFIAAMSPINIGNGMPLDPDAASDPVTDTELALVRLNTTTNKSQYLHTGTLEWTDTGAGPITFFSAVRASALNPAFDGRVFLRTLGATGAMTTVDTSTWGTDDILVIGRLKVRGTPYGNYMQVGVVGKFGRHSKPLALLGLP